MFSKFGSWAKKISTYLFTHPSLFCWIFSALFSEYAPCDLISKFCNNCTPRLCKDRGKENWWWWWRCWHDDDDDDDHDHDVDDDDSDMGVPRDNPLPPSPLRIVPLSFCHFLTLFNCCCLHAQFMLYWWDMPVSDPVRQLFHSLVPQPTCCWKWLFQVRWGPCLAIPWFVSHRQIFSPHQSLKKSTKKRLTFSNAKSPK